MNSFKREVLLKVKEKLKPEEEILARRNHHAKRKPRPCGFTVHVGYGCTNRCSYCYIQDMGFSFTTPKPHPLSGLGLVYALLLNKHFTPGLYGSFIAVGSITDPFHPLLLPRTLEFIENAAKYLNNPIQFSTKHYINTKVAEKLASYSLRINPLITIVTIRKAKLLEPNAPPVELRLETVRNLRKAGLKPMIFIRPIIPGVTDTEIEEIVELAAKHGAIAAVLGSLRVTRNILNRLGKVIDTKPITSRIKKIPKNREQVYVNTYDIKVKIEETTRKLGLIAFRSACCANAYTSSVPCINKCYEKGKCVNCPNSCRDKQHIA